MIMMEKTLEIEVNDPYTAVKFDDSLFYQKKFSPSLDGAKGVDVIVSGKDHLLFLEIKDCEGHEPDNRWRIFPKNKKRDTTATKVNVDGRDSLDIEVVQKVVMSLACLVGAVRQTDTDYIRNEWNGVSYQLDLGKIPEICVILFLTGDFSTGTRTEKAVLTALQKSIASKLKWLKCRVLVENMETQRKKYYEIRRKSS